MPQIPAQLHRDLSRGLEPTDEQEAAASVLIEAATTEIRRRLTEQKVQSGRVAQDNRRNRPHRVRSLSDFDFQEDCEC